MLGNLLVAVSTSGDNAEPSQILVYKVETTGTMPGSLTELTNSPYSLTPASNPLSIAFTPIVNQKLYAATANEATNNVSVYAVVDQPTVTSITPASGTPSGGTSVTIAGTNFISPATVNFGNNLGTDVTVNSTTEITVTSPAGTGTVDVVVSTSGGLSPVSPADEFTYAAAVAPTITGISPNSGPTTGGTTITITGTNFTGVTNVLINGVPVRSFTFVSPTQITAVTPPGTTGSVNVSVVTPSGTGTSSTVTFTYITASGVLPPTSLSGKRIANKFLTSTDLVNVISWKAPKTGAVPTTYLIYRDAGLTQLAGTVSAATLQFEDHNRRKHTSYTYYIVSVDASGNRSAYAFIQF